MSTNTTERPDNTTNSTEAPSSPQTVTGTSQSTSIPVAEIAAPTTEKTKANVAPNKDSELPPKTSENNSEDSKNNETNQTSTTTTAEVSHSSIGNMNQAGVINNHYTTIEEQYAAEGTQREILTEHHFQHIPMEQLTHADKDLIFDPAVLAQCHQHLKTHRILCLTGQAELGKTSLAQKLGHDLSNQAKNVRINHRLHTHIRCDLLSIASDKQLGQHSTLIFNDPFQATASLAPEHHGLYRDNIFKHPVKLENISKRLASKHCFLLFTADQDTLSEDWKAAPFTLAIEPPDKKTLETYLQNKISQAGIEFNTDQQQQLLEHFKTLPPLIRFLQQSGILNSNISINLELALQRHTRIDQWFLAELPQQNSAAWHLSLAVLLNNASDALPSLTSFAIHGLSEALSSALSTSLSAYAAYSPAASLATPPPSGQAQASIAAHQHLELASQHDQAILASSRLQTRPGLNEQGQLLGFNEPHHSSQLWHALIHHGHGLVARLIPILIRWASENDHPYQAIAAASIGRLGELDPRPLTQTLITCHIGESHWQAYLPLSALFHGIRASQNPHYRDIQLQAFIRHCHRPEYIRTGFLVLREIGIHEPAVALQILFNSMQKIFDKKLKNIEALWQAIDSSTEKANRETRNAGISTGSIQQKHKIKQHLLQLLIEQDQFFSDLQNQTFDAAQFTFAGLCFGIDPLSVAHHCLPILPNCKTELIALIALLWIDNHGVFQRMQDHPLRLDLDNTGQQQKLNRTVVAMADNPHKIESFARYIATLDSALAIFPAFMEEQLREQQIQHLKTWIRDAVKTELSSRCIKHLLIKLHQHAEADLWENIYELLTRDSDFRIHGTPMNALAMDVLSSV